jgi:hypothetical protein
VERQRVILVNESNVLRIGFHNLSDQTGRL